MSRCYSLIDTERRADRARHPNERYKKIFDSIKKSPLGSGELTERDTHSLLVSNNKNDNSMIIISRYKGKVNR